MAGLKGAKPAPAVTGNGLRDEHSGKRLDHSLTPTALRHQVDRPTAELLRERVKKHRAAKKAAAPSVTVTDKPEAAATSKAAYAAAELNDPDPAAPPVTADKPKRNTPTKVEKATESELSAIIRRERDAAERAFETLTVDPVAQIASAISSEKTASLVTEFADFFTDLTTELNPKAEPTNETPKVAGAMEAAS